MPWDWFHCPVWHGPRPTEATVLKVEVSRSEDRQRVYHVVAGQAWNANIEPCK